MISKKDAVSAISDLLMIKLNGERLPTYNEVYHAVHDLPSVDAVPTGVYKQVRWERDIAMQQLDALGYGLGEKVVPVVRCKDCKHHHYSICEIPYCDRIDYGYGWNGEDFCSYGEREDGDHAEGTIQKERT